MNHSQTMNASDLQFNNFMNNSQVNGNHMNSVQKEQFNSYGDEDFQEFTPKQTAST